MVAIAFAMVAAGGVAASAWLWTQLEGERDALRTTQATLAAESSARTSDAATAARKLSAVESDLARSVTAAKEADEARVRQEKAADALISSFLRSSEAELGGSATTLAREVLRGNALEELNASLPEAKYLAVALAVAEALAREPSAVNPAELYRDLTFAADLALRARAGLEPTSATLGDALHAVAQLMWSARKLPFVEPKVADALLADAAKFAAQAREARALAGGRRLALTLLLLAEIDRRAGRLTEASALLATADLEVLKDGTPMEVAAVELVLAEVLFELARNQQAVDLLEARASNLERLSEREWPQAIVVALRLRETRLTMLRVMGLDKSNATEWLLEQVRLARTQLRAKRYLAVYETLPAVLKAFERDQSRFRERLECATMLARAMDALGSTKSASDLLEQKQLIDDARILGVESPLAREFAALREALQESLRAKSGR